MAPRSRFSPEGGSAAATPLDSDAHHLHVTVETRTDVRPENQEAAVVLFNAMRELLFNVVKHAGVSEAQVILDEKEGRVQLTVEDQGTGFDSALIRERANGGFGLLSVRERMRLIGGELQIQSTSGDGTSIVLLAPPSSPAEAPLKGAPAETKALLLDPASQLLEPCIREIHDLTFSGCTSPNPGETTSFYQARGQ